MSRSRLYRLKVYDLDSGNLLDVKRLFADGHCLSMKKYNRKFKPKFGRYRFIIKNENTKKVYEYNFIKYLDSSGKKIKLKRVR